MIKRSTEVSEQLVRIYPENVVKAQLEQLYKLKIDQTLAEIAVLLPQYCAAVDAQTYAWAHAELRRAVTYSLADAPMVEGLERVLRDLTKQQQTFVQTLRKVERHKED